MNILRHDGRNLLVISTYALTDFRPNAVKDNFYQRLHGLLRTAKRGGIVTLAEDLDFRVDQLFSNETHLRDSLGPDFCCSGKGGRLLALYSDRRLFLAGTNFRRSNRRYHIRYSPYSSQR